MFQIKTFFKSKHVILIFKFSGWKSKEQTQNEDSDIDTVLTREKKLVDKYVIKSGMLRFSFLLECSHPGSIPDPQLVAAMLELVCVFINTLNY